MSYALPKEAQTQKISSLPDDLKSIAEDLIKNKFKIKEKKPQTAWGDFPTHSHGSAWAKGPLPVTSFGIENDSYTYDSRRRGEVRVDINPYTREHRATAFIPGHGSPLDGLAEAMRALDEGNIPDEDRKMFIDARRFHDLKISPPTNFEFREGYVPRLWGAELITIGPGQMERIEAIF